MPIIATEVRSEIETFLVIGNPARELTADREPSSPGRSGPGHGDLVLLGLGPSEEGTGHGLESILKDRIDAVPDYREETDRTAGDIERGGHLGGSGPVGPQWTYVDL